MYESSTVEDEEGAVESMFVLDVQIVTDVRVGDVAAACNTDDGCGHTCASACASEF